MADKAERRPRRKGGAPDAHGGGITASIGPVRELDEYRQRQRCPLVRGAVRTGDPAVLIAVLRVHKPRHCPAARRERRP